MGGQKSAEAIVAASHGGEGPNTRSRIGTERSMREEGADKRAGMPERIGKASDGIAEDTDLARQARTGGKGMRMLGIPTVLDRLIQQALLQVLQPLFDPGFSDNSFGFRPGRSTHQAVRRAREHIAAGHRWVVDMDLEKFFDRVNHDVLMARVARRVKDKKVLILIRRFLQAGLGGLLQIGGGEGNLRGTGRMVTTETPLHPVAAVEASPHAVQGALPTWPGSRAGQAVCIQRAGPLVECRGQAHEPGRSHRRTVPTGSAQPAG